MTDMLTEHSRPSAAHRHWASRRKPIFAAAVAAFLAVASLVTYTVARHLDHQYGPIQSGSFGGLYSERNFVFSKDGFSYSLAPTPGVSGQLIASISNGGEHSVQITSIDTDDFVSAIRWSSYKQAVNVDGASTPWRPFPAIVPGHGTIRLLITIHHPSDCGAYPKGTALYTGFHTVHWDSLLHGHTTEINDGLQDRNIAVC